jgi:hypothetical protein
MAMQNMFAKLTDDALVAVIKGSPPDNGTHVRQSNLQLADNQLGWLQQCSFVNVLQGLRRRFKHASNWSLWRFHTDSVLRVFDVVSIAEIRSVESGWQRSTHHYLVISISINGVQGHWNPRCDLEEKQEGRWAGIPCDMEYPPEGGVRIKLKQEPLVGARSSADFHNVTRTGEPIYNMLTTDAALAEAHGWINVSTDILRSEQVADRFIADATLTLRTAMDMEGLNQADVTRSCESRSIAASARRQKAWVYLPNRDHWDKSIWQLSAVQLYVLLKAHRQPHAGKKGDLAVRLSRHLAGKIMERQDSENV